MTQVDTSWSMWNKWKKEKRVSRSTWNNWNKNKGVFRSTWNKVEQGQGVCPAEPLHLCQSGSTKACIDIQQIPRVTFSKAQSSKLKARTSLLPRFNEKRPSSFELRALVLAVLIFSWYEEREVHNYDHMSTCNLRKMRFLIIAFSNRFVHFYSNLCMLSNPFLRSKT